MLKFIAGTVFGLALSIAYVWYGITLPAWTEFPSMFQRSLTAAATEDTLIDLDTPDDQRRRALEIYFANQPNRAAAVEAGLGYPITQELQLRRARRTAQILLAKWKGYDQVLAKPALREAMAKKHGNPSNDETLKQRMLLAALLNESFLMKWIKHHLYNPSEENARDLLDEIRQRRNVPSH